MADLTFNKIVCISPEESNSIFLMDIQTHSDSTNGGHVGSSRGRMRGPLAQSLECGAGDQPDFQYHPSGPRIYFIMKSIW
jgi:hypothetical protein